MITFESGLKKWNTWITINSQSESEHVNLLRKASIKSLLDSVSIDVEKGFHLKAHWGFDSSGVKVGYYLSIFITRDNGDKYEVQPTTKYPWQEPRLFKSFEALQSYAIDLGAESIVVDFG